MRLDNRPNDALRPVTIQRHFTKHAEGSVLIACGHTQVICTASFSDKVPPFLKGTGKGWVTAEYAMLPRSTHDRIRRDASKKGRALEISRLIGRSLRSVVDFEALGECQVILDCDVIQADGGTRTASITGAYVALHDAFTKLVAEGKLESVPLRGQCAAVSVGMNAGTPLLDLCYEEDFAADVDLNLVMLATGEFVEIQACAEGLPLPRSGMDAMLDVADKGIRELFSLQNKALNNGCS